MALRCAVLHCLHLCYNNLKCLPELYSRLPNHSGVARCKHVSQPQIAKHSRIAKPLELPIGSTVDRAVANHRLHGASL
eukprot:5250743-Heterocapsa_arctica.AAC.1